MRTLTLVLVTSCCPLLVAAGEAAPAPAPAPAPAKGEVNASLQVLAPRPFLSPKDAMGEGVKLALAEGKAKLALPVKDGGVTIFYARNNVAVVPGDAANAGNAMAIPVPKEGFSQVVSMDLPAADGSTTKVALTFARGAGDSELICRNLAVAVTKAGGCPVYVVDDNCNGKYNDAGEDGILISAGRLAVPLGGTVMLEGVAHKVTVAENGRKMTFTPAPDKVGPVGLLNQGAYGASLLGAVLKGPDGSCFALLPNTAMLLPVGEYSLAYASLMDAAGHKAIIKGGEMKVTVAEGAVPTVVNLGAPRLQLTAKIDAKVGNVTLTAAGSEGVECDAGKITYLFTTPQATIRFMDQSSSTKKVVGSLVVGMEGKELNTTFSPGTYGMAWGGNYQADVIWLVGVGPAPYGSVSLNLPRR